MSNFELADIDTSFEPSIELVDGIVNDLYWAHGKIDVDETPWLVPKNALNNALPDALQHTKIKKMQKGWQLAVAQRFLDHSFPKHTATKVQTYSYHSSVGVHLTEYMVRRNTLVPTLNPFSEEEQQGDFTRELYDHLANSVLIPKSRVYEGFSGQLAERKGTIEKDRNLLRHGSRVMRLAERSYLGFSPDFSQY